MQSATLSWRSYIQFSLPHVTFPKRPCTHSSLKSGFLARDQTWLNINWFLEGRKEGRGKLKLVYAPLLGQHVHASITKYIIYCIIMAVNLINPWINSNVKPTNQIHLYCRRRSFLSYCYFTKQGLVFNANNVYRLVQSHPTLNTMQVQNW